MEFILIFISLFVLGFASLNIFKNSAGFLESLSLSFLLGIFWTTLLMFTFEILSLKISYSSLLISQVLIFIFLILVRFNAIKENCKKLFRRIRLKQIIEKVRTTSLLQILLTLVLLFLVVFNVARANYWPPTAYDNITGYDLMAKVLANEGTFNNSLFDENGTPIDGSAKRLVYPPQTACSFALAYMTGLSTSKIIPSLFTIFFILIYYLALVRFIPKTITVFLTILMFIIPDFYYFSMMASSNIIFAIYLSLGIIYLFTWYNHKETWMLIISSIFFAAATWTRSEAIVVIAAVFLVMIFFFDFKKNYLKIISFIAPALILFLGWNLFVGANYNVDQNVFHDSIFINFDKIKNLIQLVYMLFTYTPSLGIAFYLLAITILLSIPSLAKNKTFRVLTYLLFVPILAYTFIYYQMDNSEMDDLVKMITASYKRGILAFIPIIFFYIGNSPYINKLSAQLEEKLTPTKIITE